MRLAVLASGSGTILDAMAHSGLPVSLVVVDRPCGAEKVAADHGLTCVLVERESFGPDFDRVGYTRQVTECLSAEGIELVVMAGFGTVLGQPIHDAYGWAHLEHASVAIARVSGGGTLSLMLWRTG